MHANMGGNIVIQRCSWWQKRYLKYLFWQTFTQCKVLVTRSTQ